MQHIPKILVAEDDEMIRKIVEEVLANDFELHFAADGSVALELANEIQPEMVILDIMMPKLDGFKVCKRLREIPELKRTIIIMLTALTDQDSQRTGISAGADDYLTKPFNPIDLRTKVNLLFRLRDRFLCD
jgi:DNA-binding response OmpR family regulator